MSTMFVVIILSTCVVADTCRLACHSRRCDGNVKDCHVYQYRGSSDATGILNTVDWHLGSNDRQPNRDVGQAAIQRWKRLPHDSDTKSSQSKQLHLRE